MALKSKDLGMHVLPEYLADLKLHCLIVNTRICKLLFTRCGFRTMQCYLPGSWGCARLMTRCFPETYCRWMSPCQGVTEIACQMGTVNCPGGSMCPGGSVYDPGDIYIDPIFDPHSVEILKEQLKLTLKHLESTEEEMQEFFRAQSLDEVEILERRLKDAQAELAKRKTELGKKGSK